MASPTPVLRALNEYRNTIRNTAYWEEHGTHGDGRLAEATNREKRVRTELLQAMQAWKDAD